MNERGWSNTRSSTKKEGAASKLTDSLSLSEWAQVSVEVCSMYHRGTEEDDDGNNGTTSRRRASTSY